MDLGEDMVLEVAEDKTREARMFGAVTLDVGVGVGVGRRGWKGRVSGQMKA